jgi:hypothetical protein
VRRKIKIEEGFEEGELVERWSRRRLLVALVTLVTLGVLGYFAFKEVGDKTKQFSMANVKGESTKEDVKLPTKEDIDRVLEEVRQQLSNITSENITASEAAVQKAITDLQKIQTGSQSAVGAFCELVCKK